MDCSMPDFPVLHCLLKFVQTLCTESVMPSTHLIFCHPLLLPSTFPSFWVFSNKLALHIRWPNYWNVSFSISPSNEYSGLISLRIQLAWSPCSQVTLKNLLQHSSKALVLQRSALFMVQLSDPYMTTRKKWYLWLDELCQQSDVSAF